MFCAFLRVYATRDLFLLGLEGVHGWRWDGNPGLGLTALGRAHCLFWHGYRDHQFAPHLKLSPKILLSILQVLMAPASFCRRTELEGSSCNPLWYEEIASSYSPRPRWKSPKVVSALTAFRTNGDRRSSGGGKIIVATPLREPTTGGDLRNFIRRHRSGNMPIAAPGGVPCRVLLLAGYGFSEL